MGYEKYGTWPDPAGRARGDYDRIGNIIAYESGELSHEDTLILFADLIKSGMAWRLQGFYGRNAARLINAGLISREGEVL